MATESRVVDLCFVMDCTGSMGSYISACKNDINVTISKISTEHPGTVINLGFVAYRDHCDGANRIQKFGFSADIQRFQSFVGSLGATGGGDYPEDVLGGIWESATMAWSAPTRVLFHIFDAPPHGCPKYHDEGGDSHPNGHPNDKSLEEILGNLRDNFVDYYLLKLTNNLEKMVSVFLSTARAIGYDHIEERVGVGEVSKVMEDVGTAVLDSMAVRVSTKSRPHARLDALIQPRAASNTYKVYCGIDFGTHGSAFAFCSAGDPTVRAANSWGGNSVDVKTLTNLLLGPDKKCVPGRSGFGDAALECYLDMDAAEQKSHFFFRRFKMALYEEANKNRDQENGDGVDIEGRIVAANGKRVKSETVLVEALKFMVNHVMGEIREQYEDVTDPADVQWIVTVPAIWSQKSRKVMEKAAYTAGIPRGKHDQLIVALEPECASVVVQDCLNLAEGKCYMMIDCGGGTVDVACHEVINGGAEVREIWKATGGAWGATYIDDEFMSFLEAVLGEDVMAAVEEEMKEEAPALIESIIASFNSAKVMALPTEERRNVNVGMLKQILLDVIGSVEDINEHLGSATYRGHVGGVSFKARGMLTLSREIWDELFGVVIDPLVEHVKGLLAEPELAGRMETLCVVGGFAESPILMDRLKSEFGETCRVMRPPNPILTVVKGAAKFGLMPTTIASRKAPKTMGIAVRDVWQAETDEESRRTWVRGVGYMVDGVFFPFVRAGQSIPRDMAPVVHYFEPVSMDHFQIEIYQCDEANPRFVPERACGVIGPITFPSGFDHQAHDICVQIDFSGRVVQVKVQFGEDVENARNVDVDWE